MSDRSLDAASQLGGGNPHTLAIAAAQLARPTKRRIVIDLYDHTSDDEVAECVEAIRGIGFVDVRVEVGS